MKTRLNKQMRQGLRGLVNQRIEPVEAKATLAKATAVAEATVLKCIAEKFPTDDMVVLAKYNCTHRTHWIPILVVDANGNVRHGNWELPGGLDEETKAKWPVMPSTPYGNTVLRIEKEHEPSLRAYYDAVTAYNAAATELREPFFQLIHNAKHLEDIEEVWVVAREVRPYLASQLPTVHIGPLQDRVRAILESQQ